MKTYASFELNVCCFCSVESQTYGFHQFKGQTESNFVLIYNTNTDFPCLFSCTDCTASSFTLHFTTCSNAHTLLSHLQRLPKVMIINATLCNGSTLCYDFPLDNHFQCQIIQFIRTNNTSGLTIWMENSVMCTLQSHHIELGRFCVRVYYSYVKRKITTNPIRLGILCKIPSNSTHHQLTKTSITLKNAVYTQRRWIMQFNLRFQAWLESNLYSN